jgi:hypothetical protein
MRKQLWVFCVAALVSLSACSDNGKSPVETDQGERGAITFRILKSEIPQDILVIRTRLDRQGFTSRTDSVFVRSTLDTIQITISNVPAGYWKVTVDASDSTGTIRYKGSSSVLIVEGQTVQAFVQMNPVGGMGSVEIIIVWPSGQPYIQICTPRDIFLVDEHIPVTVTNTSREMVNLASCCTRPDLRLQQEIDDTWTPPGQCELDCVSIPLPLKPGATITDSVLQIPLPGMYRMMLRYWTDTLSASAVVFEAYSNDFTIVSRDSGVAHITVYVHWGDTPIAQKKVELLQTGEVKFTNENGLAEFEVKPGSYTVRAYDINRGGPCCAYVDFSVTVNVSDTKSVDVVDCLPCL